MPRRRMAWEQLPQQERSIVRDALRPWDRRLGVLADDGSFKADLWEGATPDNFIKRHDLVRDELADMVRNGNHNEARDMLMRRHNHNLEDANQQIYLMERAAKGRLGNQSPETMDLQKLSMSVPQAEADEHLSRALLELNGWQNVQSPKDTTTRATDISGEFQGYHTLIDAESRTGATGRLNLGLIADLRQDKALLQQGFARLPNDALIMDYIRKIRDESRKGDVGRYQSGREDKLLATLSGFNDSPTQHFIKNADVLEKDGIITSDRRGPARAVHPDHPRLKPWSPPYNPELPQGWDLLDLDQARSVLSGMKKRDLIDRNSGYQLFFNRKGGGSQINVGISADRLKQLTGNLGGLSPQSIQALTA